MEHTECTVDAPCGRLKGIRKGGVSVFRGIPFALPPAGERRFLPPEKLPPWPGERDATRFGFICPQAPAAMEGLLGAALGEQSEDCLFLNVWTPGTDAQRRPVMVWLHGGAYAFGAGSQGIYNGRHLASRGDVVVVTLNYRLGALGFLNLSDATDGALPGLGSEGLMDQIEGLLWVRENIASFGGDPDNVTLFGESAGGMSVACLLASPLSRGLFHKAIAQSGAGHIGYARERSARVAAAFLAELGLSPANAREVLALPHQKLAGAQLAILRNARDGDEPEHLGKMPFQPTIEGVVLRDHPFATMQRGEGMEGPLLVGTTREEWRLFTAIDPRARLTFASGAERRIAAAMGAHADLVGAAYREGSGFERWNAFMTDRIFTVPALRLANAHGANGNPTYLYRFDWTSPLMGGVFGACHALELGFVWGTHAGRLANKFFGDGPDAAALSAAMMDAWIAFARAGDPSVGEMPWPPFAAGGRVMVFGRDAPQTQMQAPDAARLRAWSEVPDRLVGT
ncbi:MAG: carboxylesterase/lipase family protein [Alphaproteobacteria bacterium]|nr:carboxylesterase/lipase family protein [Alphaproteobacteria bacterium]